MLHISVDFTAHDLSTKNYQFPKWHNIQPLENKIKTILLDHFYTLLFDLSLLFVSLHRL